ncbi:hypothetical protein ALC53_12048 [Atta colombica]|uniref:Histone-lysine N-methyltransferase SETMAR n=1 Tax=Atta colombica TaxID=520822 RepID=A0A195B023_9HYME|nr:hypothetical protein ALC53_12048 [Atta colombica]
MGKTEGKKFWKRTYEYDKMYGALEQSNEGSSMPTRKSHSRERTARTPTNKSPNVTLLRIAIEAAPHYKRDYVTILKQYLKMFQRNPDEFLHRFITVDETWIHYFILLRNLLDRYNILKKKRPHLAKKKVLLFHQNNTRVLTCPASMAKIQKCIELKGVYVEK